MTLVPPTNAPNIPVSDGSVASGQGGDGDSGTTGSGDGPDGTTLVVGAFLVGAVIAGAGVYLLKKK